MRVLISALLIALSVVVFVGCGGGGGGGPQPGTTGSLAGYIYGDSGSGMVASARVLADQTPLVGATITVSGQSVSDATDDTGYFQLDGVLTGSRQFYVEADGYTRSTFTVTINEGPNTVPSDINLETAALKWMVMVYLAADNNLDYDGGFAVEDINEMEAGMPADSPDVMTVVLSDRYGVNNTRVYQIQHDDNPSAITSPVIYTPPGGEMDTGLPSTLDWFVDYCQSTGGLPRAEHYLLVLWDHGSGWSSYDDRSISSRAIGYDESTNNMMRIVDVAQVLESNTYPIDIIASDACLMNQLEVGYEWRACGDYLVASEELTPGVGFNYTSVLSMITGQGLQMTSGQLAGKLAETVYNVWVNDYAYGSPPPVISVVNLRNLGPVATALDAFAGRLKSVGGNYASQLSRIYDNVESYGYWFDDHRVDLYDYANRVSAAINDGSLDTAAGQLKTAIDNAVIAEYHNNTSPGSHGLSIYLPKKVVYNSIRDKIYESYSGLQLSADTRWNEWLAGQPDYVDP